MTLGHSLYNNLALSIGSIPEATGVDSTSYIVSQNLVSQMSQLIAASGFNIVHAGHDFIPASATTPGDGELS